MMEIQTLTLPPEPGIDAVVEIVDGNNKGDRFRRDRGDRTGWRRIGYGDDVNRVTWSHIWWAVTEDDGGGTSVKVTYPDPNEPHPLPWTSFGDTVRDAFGDRVPPAIIVARVNAGRTP